MTAAETDHVGAASRGRLAGAETRVTLLAAAATFVTVFDATVINIAFPDLLQSFPSAPLHHLAWVVTGYAVAFAALLPSGGQVADAVGRARAFALGTGVFTVVSAACALAWSAEVLIGLRVLQGAAAALMVPAGLALLLGVVAPQRRAAALGIWGASGSLAAAAGPALGGIVVDTLGWRAIFVLNLPVGVAVVVGVRRGVAAATTPAGPRRWPDPVGAVLLGAGLAGLVLALSRAGEWGWTDARTLALMLGGPLLLGAAAARSRGRQNPALELRLFESRGLAASSVGAAAVTGALFMWLLAGSLFLTSVWGYSVLEAGLAMSPAAVAAGAASLVAGRALSGSGPDSAARPSTTEPARLLVWAAAVLAATSVGVAVFLGEEPALWTLWLPTGVVAGAAFGVALVAVTAGGTAALPPERLASGSGLLFAARQVGGAVGVATLVAVLTEAEGPAYDRFADTYLAAGLVALVAVGAGIGLGLDRDGQRDREEAR